MREEIRVDSGVFFKRSRNGLRFTGLGTFILYNKYVIEVSFTYPTVLNQLKDFRL